MNNVHFNQTGGFPLDTNVLDFMQKSLQQMQNIGYGLGDLVIVKGCEKVGSTITDGVVFIDGEILPFKGGNEGANVIISSTTTNGLNENGESIQIETTREARFGSSGSNFYKWADFKRPYKNVNIWGLISRIEALEQKPSPIPLGLVAIWNKPSNIPIPLGWQEVTDLAGKVPVGLLANDADFGTIGQTGGTKKHQLTIEEMPAHNHQQGSEALYNKFGGGIYVGGRTYVGKTEQPSYEKQNTSTTGGNQSHNNLQPYQVVKFIEYVGTP